MVAWVEVSAYDTIANVNVHKIVGILITTARIGKMIYGAYLNQNDLPRYRCIPAFTHDSCLCSPEVNIQDVKCFDCVSQYGGLFLFHKYGEYELLYTTLKILNSIVVVIRPPASINNRGKRVLKTKPIFYTQSQQNIFAPTLCSENKSL